jgi:VWFA-related protein
VSAGAGKAALSLSLLLLGFAGVVSFAGFADAGQPPAAEFAERIDVRAVDVETVVTDRQGQRVKDLKAEDFRLLVDGREERIDSFSEVREGQTEPTAPAVSAISETSATAATAETGATPPSPAFAPGGRVGTSYLVFIDDALALRSERNATLWTLKLDLALLGPGDSMSIVVFDGRSLTVLAGWTGDVAVLRDALTAETRRGSQGIFAYVAKKGIAEELNRQEAAIDYRAFYGQADLLGNSPVGRIWGLARQADSVRKVATAAAYALRAMPLPEGRRVMMILAGDWTLNAGPASLRPLTTAASLLGYTVYPVNVTGIRLLIDAVDASFRPCPSLFAPDLNLWPDANGFEGPSDSALKALARATGGVVAFNRDHSLRQVAEDTRSYYRLGFSPIWKADDLPHDIRVEVRRPGLTARARNRFFDLSPATNSALTAESVLSVGGDPARKRLVVTAGAPKRSGREGMDLPVTFAIPAELLARVPGTAPGYPVEGSLSVAAMDVAGRLISVPGQVLHGTLPEEPRPGVFVRIRSLLHLRRVQQRLVFTVTGTGESPIWTELEVKP